MPYNKTNMEQDTNSENHLIENAYKHLPLHYFIVTIKTIKFWLNYLKNERQLYKIP